MSNRRQNQNNRYESHEHTVQKLKRYLITAEPGNVSKPQERLCHW